MVAAFKIAERVKTTSTTTGTGTYTINASPVAGFQAFSSELATGDYAHYCITDGTDWEVGLGRLASSTTLERSSIVASSNADAEVNWAAGTRTIWITRPRLDDMGLREFGPGTDGDLSISSGTTTLTRDTYYANLTMSGSAQIDATLYALYVAGLTDDTRTSGTGISVTSNAGGPGTGTNTGGAAISATDKSLPGAIGGGDGCAAGTTGVGKVGVAPSAFVGQGGQGGIGGAGGLGLGGAGGTAGARGAKTDWRHELLQNPPFARGTTWVSGSNGGSGGGGGAGDGAAAVGVKSGGGGGGNAWVYFASRMIKAGGSNALINVIGAVGGVGKDAGAPNKGGAGGGGGGGGGVVYCVYQHRVGATNATFAKATGGAGGNGGAASSGTSVAGTGGTGGDGGVVLMFNLTTGVMTKTTGSAGGAPSGTTGGTGGACTAGI